MATETEYESFADWEAELESEAAERARVKKPSSQPSFKQRPSPSTPMYVTQTQLEAALSRVDGKIKTVSDGVSTINSRLTSLSTSLKKEADARKKTTESQGKDLNNKVMMLSILPALVQPTFTIPAIGSGGAPQQTISANPNALGLLLPLLAVVGTGTGDGTSSSSDNSMMFMMLALVLAMGGNPQL